MLFFLLLTPSPPDPPGSDLAGHAGGFFVLGFLLWWNIPTGPLRVAIAAVATCAVGVLSEGGQAFVAGRVPSLVDAAVNVGGALAGTLGPAFVSARLRMARVQREAVPSLA